MNQEKINQVLAEIKDKISSAMGNDLIQARLFGSCARGDYNNESDMDIVLFTRCSREKNEEYLDSLIDIGADIMNGYDVLVNFIYFPMQEFEKRKSWYPLFENIDREGVTFYG